MYVVVSSVAQGSIDQGELKAEGETRGGKGVEPEGKAAECSCGFEVVEAACDGLSVDIDARSSLFGFSSE